MLGLHLLVLEGVCAWSAQAGLLSFVLQASEDLKCAMLIYVFSFWGGVVPNQIVVFLLVPLYNHQISGTVTKRLTHVMVGQGAGLPAWRNVGVSACRRRGRNHTVDELFELFDVDEDGKIDQSSFDAWRLRFDTSKHRWPLWLVFIPCTRAIYFSKMPLCFDPGFTHFPFWKLQKWHFNAHQQ